METRLIFLLAFLTISITVFSQGEDYKFNESTFEGKIVKIYKEGPITVIKWKGYAKFLKGFVASYLYLLPENELELPKQHSVLWQRLPFVRNRYIFEVRCPYHKVFMYEDIRELCFEEYDVCIKIGDGDDGRFCELIEIKKIK